MEHKAWLNLLLLYLGNRLLIRKNSKDQEET